MSAYGLAHHAPRDVGFVSHSSNVATMHDLAERLERLLPVADHIDTLTAIRVDEAVQRVHAWLQAYGVVSPKAEP